MKKDKDLDHLKLCILRLCTYKPYGKKSSGARTCIKTDKNIVVEFKIPLMNSALIEYLQQRP